MLPIHNCLGFTVPSFVGPDEWLFGRDREVRLAIKGTLRTNSGDALMAAAVAGLGVIYTPDFVVADAIRRGALERVALDVPTGDLGGIHIV